MLDYRHWFEFQLFYQKEGENWRELTDRAFYQFSGGEKAMAMYLIQALKILDSEVQERNSLTIPLSGTEELTELYYSFGLLRDDLWNFVTCTGITATAVDHRKEPLSFLSEAYRQQVSIAHQ